MQNINKFNKAYSVVICTSNQYAQYVPCLFESILFNCTEKLNFFVLYSELEDKNRKIIEKIVSQKEEFTITFVKFDFLKEIKSNDVHNFPMFRNSYDTYSKLFISKILFRDFDVEWCLYLDIDMVVNQSLDLLFSFYNHKLLIGAVIDSDAGKKEHFSHDYFNAGMLLLNLKKLEEFNFTDKALKCLLDNNYNLKYFDQDIMNRIIPKDMIYYVDDRYNMQYTSADKVKNGVILHFTGTDKPWLVKSAWRYKKCMWHKFNLLSILALKNVSTNQKTERILHYLLIFSRPVLSVIRKIKLVFSSGKFYLFH